jgi:hypothetical protein
MVLRFPFEQHAFVINSLSTVEQRFRERQSQMTLRFRERLGFDYSFSKTRTAVIWDEVLISVVRPDWAGPSAFDQNRAFVGLRFPIGVKDTMTIGYMNQFLERSPNNIMNHLLIMFFNF